MRVPWTARRSHQSILKQISPEYSLEGLMLKLKFQYFGYLMWRADSFEKTLRLGKIEQGVLLPVQFLPLVGRRRFMPEPWVPGERSGERGGPLPGLSGPASSRRNRWGGCGEPTTSHSVLSVQAPQSSVICASVFCRWRGEAPAGEIIAWRVRRGSGPSFLLKHRPVPLLLMWPGESACVLG